MRLKVLAEDDFQILGCMEGDECEADDFLSHGEAAYRASRAGLRIILGHIAVAGLQQCPVNWVHLADKGNEIYEIRKGDLRLFFFKGHGRQIAVCSTGVMKKGQKADRAAVAAAARWKNKYFAAHAAMNIEVIP